MKHRGFTLVELLVVIAIIVALLAILMPALGKAVEHAKFTTCQSNVRQLATAAHSYMSDSFGKFPDAKLWAPDNVGAGYHAWHKASAVTGGLLWSYAPNAELYLCESFAGTYARGAPYWCGETTAAAVTPAFSYSMNAYLGWTGWLNQWGTTPLVSFGSLAMLKNPSQTFFIAEENAWAQTGTYAAFGMNNGMLGWRALMPPSWHPPDLFATYHYPPRGDVTAGSASAVFVDGHAQRVWNHETKAYGFDPMW